MQAGYEYNQDERKRGTEIVFIFSQITAFHLSLSLLLSGFQGVQFLLRRGDFLFQGFLLLGKEFCIGGIQLKEPVDILQLGGCAFDRLFNRFEGFVQARGITANLNCNTLYIGHFLSPFSYNRSLYYF